MSPPQRVGVTQVWIIRSNIWGHRGQLRGGPGCLWSPDLPGLCPESQLRKPDALQNSQFWVPSCHTQGSRTPMPRSRGAPPRPTPLKKKEKKTRSGKHLDGHEHPELKGCLRPAPTHMQITGARADAPLPPVAAATGPRSCSLGLVTSGARRRHPWGLRAPPSTCRGREAERAPAGPGSCRAVSRATGCRCPHSAEPGSGRPGLPPPASQLVVPRDSRPPSPALALHAQGCLQVRLWPWPHVPTDPGAPALGALPPTAPGAPGQLRSRPHPAPIPSPVETFREELRKPRGERRLVDDCKFCFSGRKTKTKKSNSTKTRNYSKESSG